MKMMTVSCRTAEYSVITIRVQTVMRKCKSINQISKDTDLYKLYNTNLHEKIAMQKAKELSEKSH